MKEQIVIVSAVRTPFSKFGGVLRDMRSIDLGAVVIKEVLNRVGVDPGEVDELYYGTCIPAEVAAEGGVAGRQALLLAGLPNGTISLTIDRACCSSLTAVQLGCRAIRSGVAEVVIAAGAENMSRACYLVSSSIRWGTRLGPIIMEDKLFELGQAKGVNPVALDTGEVALEHGVTREDQDQWALLSQQRYARAYAEGKFKEQIMPIEVPQKKGPPIIFDKDEFPKPETTLEKLAKLPTVYGSPTVTSGNAPGLDAGASAILFMTEKKSKELGLVPLATILSVSSVARVPREMAITPAFAIEKALSDSSITLDEIDLIEINEAFAAMPLLGIKLLAKNDPEKMELLRQKTNVNGGAIAIGHPVGASGARILMTLMYELRRRGGEYGVCAICGGFGQGDGAVIKVGK